MRKLLSQTFRLSGEMKMSRCRYTVMFSASGQEVSVLGYRGVPKAHASKS